MTFGHHDLPYENNDQRAKPREWEVVDEDGEVKGTFYSRKDAIYAAGMLMFRACKPMFVENIKDKERETQENIQHIRKPKSLSSICRESLSKITKSEEYILDRIVNGDDAGPDLVS